MRHSQNLNELILLAGCSAGLAFLARLNPGFYFPVLLLRLGFYCYCAYVVGYLEGRREIALLSGTAVLLGLLGASWDDWEIWLRFHPDSIITGGLIGTALIAIAIGFLMLHLKGERDAAQK